MAEIDSPPRQSYHPDMGPEEPGSGSPYQYEVEGMSPPGPSASYSSPCRELQPQPHGHGRRSAERKRWNPILGAFVAAGPSPETRKRWNPILGAFVNSGPVETDVRAEIVGENMRSYNDAMSKVLRREGVYDPVFWRHRMTGEKAGQEKYSGRRKLGKEATGVRDALKIQDRQPSPVKVEPKWNQKQADHVRGLLNPSECTPESSSRRTGAGKTVGRQVDHVRSLLHQQPGTLGPDDAPEPMHGTRHIYARNNCGQEDMCVANLLSFDRAMRIRDEAASRNPLRKSVLSDAMRSGEDVHRVLHPESPIPPHWSPGRTPQSGRRTESPGYTEAKARAASPALPRPPRPEWIDHDSAARPASFPRPQRPQWIDHDSSAMEARAQSPPRPPRPEWLDHEKPHPSPTRVRAAPARPAWLTDEGPRQPQRALSTGRPARPEYMDYSALYQAAESGPLKARELRMRR